jgi:hypothetical protein
MGRNGALDGVIARIQYILQNASNFAIQDGPWTSSNLSMYNIHVC